jgi:photosystem II stability/assembly factor-like uncharacterized protein
MSRNDFMKKYILPFIIFISSHQLNAQWITLSTGTNEQLNKIHFIDQNTGFIAGNTGVILKTINGGSNWITLNQVTADLFAIYFFNENSGIVTGANGLILKTTNGGSNWNTIPSGSTDLLLSISFYDSIGIIGGTSQSILRSSDSGDSWTDIKSGFFGGGYRGAYMLNSSTGFVAGVNAIFAPLVGKTTNGGLNWNYVTFYVNNNEATLQDIHFIDENTGVTVSSIFDGTGGISRSINGGQNWTHLQFGEALYGVDFPNSQTGFAVGLNGLALKTENGGVTWMAMNSNTSSNLRDVSFVDINTGYAAGTNGTVIKTTSGGVLNVQTISNIIPEKFELHQNYPNPFNPTTNIKFSLPNTKYTILKVFDITGKEIATLVKEILQGGEYNYEFRISNYDLPSGVYFYQLKSGNFNQTRKMIIIK